MIGPTDLLHPSPAPHKELKKKKWLILLGCVQWAFGGKKTQYSVPEELPPQKCPPKWKIQSLHLTELVLFSLGHAYNQYSIIYFR